MYKQSKMGHQGHMRLLLSVPSGDVRRILLKQVQVDLYIFISKNMVKYYLSFFTRTRISFSCFIFLASNMFPLKIKIYYKTQRNKICTLHRNIYFVCVLFMFKKTLRIRSTKSVKRLLEETSALAFILDAEIMV